MHRRSFAPRNRFPVRRKRSVQWARFTQNDAAPAVGTNIYDLLASYQTAFGITLNFPHVTIGRVIIKISVTITSASLAANNGALISLGVVDRTDVGTTSVNNPVTAPYDIPYMWWEQLYETEQVLQTGVMTNLVLYRSLDVRSKRKLLSPGETLGLTVIATGNAVLTGVSMTGNTLLLLP